MSTPHIRDYQGKHIHMIGIGGSSMSGLAQMLLEKGYRLTGSDNLETYATRHLRDDLHIPVTIGHNAENIQGADCIIRTAAAHNDNPEIAAARASGIPGGLIRLSAGLENAEDIIADLEQALTQL